jgi:hypothetical protein
MSARAYCQLSCCSAEKELLCCTFMFLLFDTVRHTQYAVPMAGERSLLCNLSPRVLRLAPCNLAKVWGLTVVYLS